MSLCIIRGRCLTIMEATSNNPSTNKIGTGINVKKIQDAVSNSGFPLQTQIANLLRSKFHVQEEWTYIDPESKELRAIDILANMMLWDKEKFTPSLRIYPNLSLVIECKKSELPHIFFICPKQKWLPYFPLLAGLRKTNSISVITDDSASSYEMRIISALSLDSHQFFKEPECSNLFTKCVRKGKQLEFSGTESFHGIVLPLLKAMRQLQIVYAPTPTTAFFHFNIILGIGIIDGPMVGAYISKKSQKLKLLPWVRVVRHEIEENPDIFQSSRLFAIDVIHKDFFKEYLDKNLIPFAEEFSKLAIKHQKVLTSGKGFVKGMKNNSWTNLEQRLQPVKMKNKVVRIKIGLKNMIEVLTGRKPPYSD